MALSKNFPYSGGNVVYYYKVASDCSGDKTVTTSKTGSDDIDVTLGGGSIAVNAEKNKSTSPKSLSVDVKLNNKSCNTINVTQDPYVCSCKETIDENGSFEWYNLSNIPNGLDAGTEIASFQYEQGVQDCLLNITATKDGNPFPLDENNGSVSIVNEIPINETLNDITYVFDATMDGESSPCRHEEITQSKYVCGCDNTLQNFRWNPDLENLLTQEGVDVPINTQIATYGKKVSVCELTTSLNGDPSYLTVTPNQILTAKVIPANDGTSSKSYTFVVGMGDGTCYTTTISQGACDCTKLTSFTVDTELLSTSDEKAVGAKIGELTLSRNACSEVLSGVITDDKNRTFNTHLVENGNSFDIILDTKIPNNEDKKTDDDDGSIKFTLPIVIDGNSCSSLTWIQESSYVRCTCTQDPSVIKDKVVHFTATPIPQNGLPTRTTVGYFEVTREKCKSEMSVTLDGNPLTIEWNGMVGNLKLATSIAPNDEYTEKVFTLKVYHDGDYGHEECNVEYDRITQTPKTPCSCETVIQSINPIYDDGDNPIPNSGLTSGQGLLSVTLKYTECSSNISVYYYKADKNWVVDESSKVKLTPSPMTSDNRIDFLMPSDQSKIILANEDYPPLHFVARVFVKNSLTDEDDQCGESNYKMSQDGEMTCKCKDAKEFFKPQDRVQIIGNQLFIEVPKSGFTDFEVILTADTAMYTKATHELYSVCGALTATSESYEILTPQDGKYVIVDSASSPGAEYPNLFYFKVKVKSSTIDGTGQIVLWFMPYKSDGSTGEIEECSNISITLLQRTSTCESMPKIDLNYSRWPCYEREHIQINRPSASLASKDLFWLGKLEDEENSFFSNLQMVYSTRSNDRHQLAMYADVHEKNMTDDYIPTTILVSGYSEPQFTTDIEEEKNISTYIQGTGTLVCTSSITVHQEICPHCSCEYLKQDLICSISRDIDFGVGIIPQGTVKIVDKCGNGFYDGYLSGFLDGCEITLVFKDVYGNILYDDDGEYLGRDINHPVIVKHSGVDTFAAWLEVVESRDIYGEFLGYSTAVKAKTLVTINNQTIYEYVYIGVGITKNGEYEECSDFMITLKSKELDCPSCEEIFANPYFIPYRDQTFTCQHSLGLTYNASKQECFTYRAFTCDANGNHMPYDWLTCTDRYENYLYAYIEEYNYGTENRVGYIKIYVVDADANAENQKLTYQGQECSIVFKYTEEPCDEINCPSKEESCSSFSFNMTLNRSEYYDSTIEVEGTYINIFKIPHEGTGGVDSYGQVSEDAITYLVGSFDEEIPEVMKNGCIKTSATTNSNTYGDYKIVPEVLYYTVDGQGKTTLYDTYQEGSKLGLFVAFKKYESEVEGNLDAAYHLLYNSKTMGISQCYRSNGLSKSVFFQFKIT